MAAGGMGRGRKVAAGLSGWGVASVGEAAGGKRRAGEFGVLM